MLTPTTRSSGEPVPTTGEISDLVRRLVDERLAASARGSRGRRASETHARATSTPTRSATTTVTGHRPRVQREPPTPLLPAPPPGSGDGDGGSSTSEQLDAVERIVAAVERRILAELNRRAGRYGGW